MKGRAVRERRSHILHMLHARGQECVNMGRQEEIAERWGLLGIPTGTHNR